MAAKDDLRKRLRAIAQRYGQWSEAFSAAYARLARERLGRWRRPCGAQHEEIAAEARRRAGEDFERELSAFLDELCDAYLAEPLVQNRAKLRADIGSNEGLLDALWAYAVQSVELVRSSADTQRLERALAAISIDDLRTDALQVDALLARAWLAAVGAGLDPRAALAKVAAVSNPGMGGGGACLAPRIAEFETSLTYKRDVEPQLRRRTA